VAVEVVAVALAVVEVVEVIEAVEAVVAIATTAVRSYHRDSDVRSIGQPPKATEAASWGRPLGDPALPPEARLERLPGARPKTFEGDPASPIRFPTLFKGFPCPKSTRIVEQQTGCRRFPIPLPSLLSFISGR
jgi:hypothetical protein